MHRFYDSGFHMGGMHGLWWIFWVLLIGVLVYSAWGRPGKQRRNPQEAPHQALQRRLASGEITPEDYEKRKALLDRDAGSKN
ncbi:MAG: SHOCT domain-containing protein [Rubrivivax sp.]